MLVCGMDETLFPIRRTTKSASDVTNDTKNAEINRNHYLGSQSEIILDSVNSKHHSEDPNLSQECYFRVMPVRGDFSEFGDRTGQRESWLTCLWADIDLQPKNSGKVHEYPTRDEALELLDRLPPCTMLVDTGAGFHAYWTLDEHYASPSQEVDEALDRWGQYLKRIFQGEGFHIDSVWDKSRILRYPGSWHKGSNRTVSVDEEHSSMDSIYSLDTLLDTFEICSERYPGHAYESTLRAPYSLDRPADHASFLELLEESEYTPAEVLEEIGFTFEEFGSGLPESPVELFVDGSTANDQNGRRDGLFNPSGTIHVFGEWPGELSRTFDQDETVSLHRAVSEAESGTTWDAEGVYSVARNADRRTAELYREIEEHVVAALQSVDPIKYVSEAGPRFESYVMERVEAQLQLRKAVEAQKGANKSDFPIKAFPNTLARVIEGQSRSLNIDVDIVALAHMTALSSAAQGRIVYADHAGLISPNIYGMFSAPSGASKSPLIERTFRPIRDYSDKLYMMLEDRNIEDRVRMKEIEKRIEEGDVPKNSPLRDELARLRQRTDQRYWPDPAISNTTPQALQRSLMSPVGAGVVLSEISDFKKILTAGNESHVGTILKAWSQESETIRRVKDGERISGVVNGTMLIAGQVEPVEAWLAYRENIDSGLCARFLVARQMDARPRVEALPVMSDELYGDWCRVIDRGCRLYWPVYGEEPDPGVARLSPEATVALKEWDNTTIRPIQDDPQQVDAKTFASKYAVYALRIAVLFAFWDWLEADLRGEPLTVSGEHMERACAYVGWVLRNIVSSVTAEAEDDTVTNLQFVQQLRQDGKFISKSTIYQQKGNGFNDPDSAKTMLERLRAQGFLVVSPSHKSRYELTQEGLEFLNEKGGLS